eukprot:scaffold38661_cov61-Phaeocystis_antarctica.AAC.4
MRHGWGLWPACNPSCPAPVTCPMSACSEAAPPGGLTQSTGPEFSPAARSSGASVRTVMSAPHAAPQGQKEKQRNITG